MATRFSLKIKQLRNQLLIIILIISTIKPQHSELSHDKSKNIIQRTVNTVSTVPRETNYVESAFHILCICQYFNNLRTDIFSHSQLNEEEIFEKKHIKGSTNKIITFIEKSKVFSRAPKLSRRDLSQNQIIKKRKRQKEK